MTPSVITANGLTHTVSDLPAQHSVTGTSGFQAFDHILWYVGNAKQAASYYITRMGFKHVAYVLPPPKKYC
jgi:4-hydroxyphenylpyruvate dioxygenase